MKTMQTIMDAYHAKWDKYIAENHIDEDDERCGCWGWQFDEAPGFIDSAEMLLACYTYAYQDEGVLYLAEHFIPGDHYYEMAQEAIELHRALTSAVQ